MAKALPPTVAELEARLGVPAGTLDSEDLARAKAAIEDATTLALAEVGAARGEAWRVEAPAVVQLVILKAARREFENPRGLSTESIGPRSVGMTDTSGVFLTAREVAQIRRAASGRGGGFVGTVRTPSAYETSS
jgi:hypothetical protein